MSSGADQRTNASESSVVSPLANAPKFSPPSSRRRSPRRRPLHERSNSHSNQSIAPTIRVVEDVEDSSSDVYSKTPFPSQPSQILPPRKRPGYSFEGRGRGVSESSYVASTVAKFEASQTLVPKPLQPKKPVRHSTSTNNSDADTIVAASFSPSSDRFSQLSTPASSIFPDESALEVLQEERSSPRQSTIRAVPRSASSNEDLLENHALTPRASAASLASTESAESLPYHQDEPESEPQPERGVSDNWETLPEDYRASPSSGSDTSKPASSTDTQIHQPILKASTESFGYSEASSNNDRPRSFSQPSPTLHDAQHIHVSSGVRVSYPVVRAPSASSLWAETQTTPPSISFRMNPRVSHVHQWSSQLSTIPSESDRASRSIERQSQSVDGRSHSTDDYANNGRSHVPRRRETISSISSSDNASSDNNGSLQTESTVAVPLPLFSPVTRPSNEGRTSDELQDTISPLQSPPLKNKRSFLRRSDSDSRSTRSSRPGSAQSNFSAFISNTIPTWARVYYSRGEHTPLGVPDTSTESTESLRVPTATSGRTQTPSESNFPLSIYRPRNRPHQRMSNPDSASIAEEPVEQQIYVVGPPRRPVPEMFTPRLRQDRRSQARLSAWKAPSFDESLGTLFFSRQNRQILLFCLGFIFPFAWMIASVLPLPPNPDLVTPTPSQADLENQFAREFGPIDDRSYRKAMWWRNLNRVLSAVGTLLLAAIIALAILASRMS